ncbi:MAG: translation initiation factor IF-3 [Deltaproteobacteria bacterium]|nr:translation initiation factor IF-3 [Deltaproteobacteria bacterium]
MSRSKSRPPPRPSEQHRVGRRIRAREVRVIDETGEQRGIMSTQDAMELAATAGLQLVEVNPKANPPVCKIMDYGKYKYESAKREREAKKNQKTSELKEVKFRPKTHEHDFDFKLRHIRRFLAEGDKVRLVVQFRGREITHPETGRAILDRVCKGVVDLATVAQMAQLEGNRLNMVLAPKPQRAGAAPQRPRPVDGAGGPAPARAVDPDLEDLPPLPDDDDDDDDDDDEGEAVAGEAAAGGDAG